MWICHFSNHSVVGDGRCFLLLVEEDLALAATHAAMVVAAHCLTVLALDAAFLLIPADGHPAAP